MIKTEFCSCNFNSLCFSNIPTHVNQSVFFVKRVLDVRYFNMRLSSTCLLNASRK